ncbi:MAG: nucleotidyltransferase domain-containing protein [Myxococcota bacterium]
MRSREAIIERVRAALEPRGEVLEAYVFGSVARGDASAHSDVDVAVYIDPASPEPDFGHAAVLGSELMAALGRNDVDVVVLNHAPPLLYHRVLRDGVRVLSRDLAKTTTREGYALSRYCDDLGRQRVVARARAERLAKGAAGR